MHAQKTIKTRNFRTRAMPMIDRSREEKLLLEKWAASDREQFVDDLDSGDASGEELNMEFAGTWARNDCFDT